MATLIINGERVNDALLEQEFAGIKSSYEQLSPFNCCCDRDEEFRGYARQNVVARVLLTQHATQTVPEPDASDIEAALQQMKEARGGEDAFFASIGATSDDEAQIRQELSVELRVKQMIDDLCEPLMQAGDDEVQSYYAQNLDRYMTVERVRASHILKTPQRSEDREPAYQALREARQQLLDGADFNELARQHSDKVREYEEGDDELKERIGDPIDLGFFRRDELMDEFTTVAFSLNVGEISPVFATSFGYHIVTVTEREAPRPIPLTEIRDAVLEQLQTERKEQRVQELVQQLESEATIETVDDDAPTESPA